MDYQHLNEFLDLGVEKSIANLLMMKSAGIFTK